MIAGVATDTIVVSTRIMKKPMHSANSAGHGSFVRSERWCRRVGRCGSQNESTPVPWTMHSMSHDRPDGRTPAHPPPRGPGRPPSSAGASTPMEVVRRHPESPARLGDAGAEQAADAGRRRVTVYAYARVGYHRSLDLLRRNGWKGHGPVPWEHEPNRGFLRCLALLALSARAIGETAEWERCSEFLRDSSPTAYDALLSDLI